MRVNPPSIARQLLLRLLPLTLVIVLTGGSVAYFVAHRVATLAYDRALLDAALAISSQIEINKGHLLLRLPKVAEKVLLTDTSDELFYEVIDASGDSLAGNRGLPRPNAAFEDGKLYYDGRFNGKAVRVAALLNEIQGTSFMILSAETKLKRDWLVSEISLAMLLPEVLLIIAATFMMRSSVRHGLASIQPLREELLRRTHTDLSQLPLENIPEEITPIFTEVNELLTRLSAALDAQRRFIADASHQLRTPIAALQAEAEVALRAPNPSASLKKIVTATRRITHLSHQLLILNRIDPQQKQSPEIVDLAEITKNAAENLMPLASQRNIDLGFELRTAKVLGEPVWLEELACNLLDNALRYTPSGGIVTVRCNSSVNETIWEIEDSGPGIPAPEREQVFERFYRLDTTGVDGCGLGLSIVREIVHNCHACIQIEDSLNYGGALFRVTFPSADAHTAL